MQSKRSRCVDKFLGALKVIIIKKTHWLDTFGIANQKWGILKLCRNLVFEFKIVNLSTDSMLNVF